MSLRILFLVATLSTGLVRSSHAEIITFKFEGKVSTVPPTPLPKPFSLPVGPQSTVSGKIQWDTNTVGTGTSSSMTFPQHISGGLDARFGDTQLSVDNYQLIVSNNLQNVIDRISFVFASDILPSLGPITVAGTPFNAGLFRIDFSGGPTLFSTAAMPTSLNLSLAPSPANLLSDAPTGVPLIFNISTVTRLVPEPSTAWLLCTGLIALLTLPPKRVGRRNG